MTPLRKLSLTVFVATAIVVALATDLLAIVGRPLTPVSYAGVARRTVRRGGY
jgi:hypothetical protein